MSKDAWEKKCAREDELDALIDRYSRTWEVRSNLDVVASGCDREILINGTSHNVGTVREFIDALEEACAFVQNANPKWADNLEMFDVSSFWFQKATELEEELGDAVRLLEKSLSYYRHSDLGAEVGAFIDEHPTMRVHEDDDD